MRQGGGKTEMRKRKIPVGLDGRRNHATASSSRPSRQLGDARMRHPDYRRGVARTEAERTLYMSLGFLAATDKILGVTDLCVSEGKISIQRQGPLAFGDALGCAVGKDLDEA